MNYYFKPLLILVISVSLASALTYQELTTCLQNTKNQEQLCRQQSDPNKCFNDINQCSQQDHVNNKACILYSKYNSLLDLEVYYEVNPSDGKKYLVSAEKVRKITEGTGVLNTPEAKKRFDEGMKMYKPLYDDWLQSKTELKRKNLYNKFNEFQINHLEWIRYNAIFPAQYHIASIECTMDCAKRLNRPENIQLYQDRLKCNGNRPPGESVDGSTSNEKNGATLQQLQINLIKQKAQQSKIPSSPSSGTKTNNNQKSTFGFQQIFALGQFIMLAYCILI